MHRRKPIKDSPDLTKARSRWGEGRYDEALRFFDKAVRRQPNHPLALADAARAFGARFEAARAEAICARLENLAAARPDLLLAAAQSYEAAHRPLGAIGCLEKILAKHPDHPQANLDLAVLLERCNDLGRAREHVARHLDSSPSSAEGKLVDARIRSHGESLPQLEPALRELCEPGVSPNLRGEAHLLTARLLDRQGQFQEAFQMMMEGKTALERVSANAKKAAEQLDPAIQRLGAGVAEESVERWARARLDRSEADLPIALMCGPARSGSTLLGRILAAHPDIVVADEVGAFTEEILPAALTSAAGEKSESETKLLDKVLARDRIEQSLRYRRLLLECAGRTDEDPPPRLLIDKNPATLPIAGAFLRLIPNGKLVVPMRDPRDCLVSALFTHLPMNRINVAFLHPFDAVEQIRSELESWLRLRGMLGEERWIEARYEDLTSDFVSETRHVLDHLELGWDSTVGDYRQAPAQRPVASAADIGKHEPIHQRSVSRWENYEEPLGRYFDELDPLLGELGYA